MKINEIITEGPLDTMKSAWQGAKKGWNTGTGAIPGAIQGFKQGQANAQVAQQSQDVAAVKANTAGRMAAQWLGTAQSDPNANPAQLATDLQAYTQKLAGGGQVPAFRGNPLDSAQVTQYMQSAFAAADRAKMAGGTKQPTPAAPRPTAPAAPTAPTAPAPGSLAGWKQGITAQSQQPAPSAEMPAPTQPAAPAAAAPTQPAAAAPATQPAGPQLAQGVTVTNAEPIMFKFNNRNYTLGGQGAWVDSKTSKPADQSLQAFLNQQHDKFLGV